MHLALCVNTRDDETLNDVKETVKMANPYVDDVYVLCLRSESPQTMRWCRAKGYNLIVHEDSEKSDRKLTERLMFEGVEFIVWLDAGDVETNVEELLINNIRKSALPKVSGQKEICYYATFGGSALEKWSPKRLQTGIGGSELAVIKLSERWQKMGYEVTVYGDPGEDRGRHNGVLYLPWYEFNPNDYYNIFIHWRHSVRAELAAHIKCRKYYMDLHDVWDGEDVLDYIDSIDGIFVKSKYHRKMAPNIPDEKFHIIGNGIET